MERLKYFAERAVWFLPILCVVTLLLILNVSNPAESGPLLILVVFTIFYIFAACVFYGVSRLLTSLSSKLFRIKISKKKTAYLSCVLAFAPLLILALSTLGVVGVVEIALVFTLVGIGCFYVSRRLGDSL